MTTGNGPKMWVRLSRPRGEKKGHGGDDLKKAMFQKSKQQGNYKNSI